MEPIYLIVAGCLLAALLGRLIIPNILIISLRKQLFDLPNFRKVHQRPVSRLGGVTFFPVIVLIMCFMSMLQIHFGTLFDASSGNHIVREMLCLTTGLMLLYIIGICDDLIGMRYSRKFLVQILAASFIPFAGLYIHNFYGLFGLHEVTPAFGIPFTMLLTVFVTNAINLIDGIDGLASGICMVALTILGIAFAMNGIWFYALLAFVCLGVLIPFFLYNVFGNADHGSKIFMGDTGSLTLGFIMSLLAVKYIIHIGVHASVVDGAPIVLVFSLLLVPCLDVCRVVLDRLHRKAHPFKPDKTHFHHKFLSMGFTPRRSLVLIQLISFSFIALTVSLIQVGITAHWVLIIDILLWTIMNMWLNRVIRRRSYYVATSKI